LVVLLVLSLYVSTVRAAAGDAISTRATINYIFQSNALVQESSPTGNTSVGIGNGIDTSFTEDRLINFVVATNDGATVAATSGQSGVFASFTVTNTGNAVQDFLLTAVNTTANPFGAPADNIDTLLPLSVFVEDNTTPGYQPGQDTAVFIDELAAGNSATVYIVATMPVATPADVAAVTLIAQIATGGAAGEGAAITNDDNNNASPAGLYSNGATNVFAGTAVNNADTTAEETVFNDPAGLSLEDLDSTGVTQDAAANGQHSDSSAYEIQSSPVAINKTITVIDTLGGNDPHAGATLRYQLDVTTSGSSNINNLVISDNIPVNTTYTPGSIVLNGVPQTDAAFAVDSIDFSEFNGTAVIVDLSQSGALSIAPGTPNTIIFDVTID
jgi:uncharacterized repeat protein (TIGR01451 family)